MSASKYIGRSQAIVIAAKDSAGLRTYVEGLFSDDLRKAVEYAEEHLDYNAQLTINDLSKKLGFKAQGKALPASAATKYTKKVEITFGAKAAPDYRAFILKGLEKDGRFISEKEDKVVYAFTPDKVVRMVVRLKPLANIMVNEIK